ncbi:MAG TPA: YraN family protein [Bryobacteraceae bacterium]|nr:YraN family protein [Bryobacteraceae bacterium]
MRTLYRLADWLRHKHRLRVWAPAHASGRRAEDLAHRLLRRQGFTVVARNYRARGGSGEIDLIAWDGPTLVFVEVKSRLSEDYGSPDRAVDEEKQHKILRAASEYVHRSGADRNAIRFDIVNVIFSTEPELTHIPDAFAYAGPL